MPDFISVLLPVKNGGHYLQEAVDSILEQSHQNFELLVVDDHSEDGAVAGLREHPKLTRLANTGLGVSAATNLAAKHAKGEYLARMDADDIAAPTRLAVQLQYLQDNPQIGLCGAEVNIFTDTGPVGGGYGRYQTWLNALQTPTSIANNLFVESPIPNPTVMFRKQTLTQLGGFHNPSWHEDYDLYLRAHFAGITMGKPAGVLLHWRDHQQRSTRNQERYLEKQLIGCKAHYLATHVLGGRPVIICGTGPVSLAIHDALALEGVTVEAFVDIKTNAHRKKRDLPVVGYDAIEPQMNALCLGALGKPSSRLALQTIFDDKHMLVWRDYLMCA